MWLCFNDGFLSVVNDQSDPSKLMVRARRREALFDILGNDAEVVESAGADYRWRAFINREAFASMVASRITEIGYVNFKNSVPDAELHRLYMDFWQLHRQYQERDNPLRSSRDRARKPRESRELQ